MPAPAPDQVEVVELRRYVLEPGCREELLELFEDVFLEPLEEAGMRVLGHFRDLEDPNLFVWLRGFRDMPSRRAALEAFYDGDVWLRHRDAANATMVDSDDVLLLRPAAGRPLADGAGSDDPPGLVVATVWPLAGPVSQEVISLFADEVVPLLEEAGAAHAGLLVTETSPNDFPRLPVREGEHVVVTLGRFADEEAHEAHVAARGRSRRWRELENALRPRLAGALEVHRLAPAARSRLR
ncbi:MAG TPA: NIPSNAP family protein [Gaiellaceae bacterium]|nr:NIPSNAP family protein [Gaiellaceae bacterium]